MRADMNQTAKNRAISFGKPFKTQKILRMKNVSIKGKSTLNKQNQNKKTDQDFFHR